MKYLYRYFKLSFVVSFALLTFCSQPVQTQNSDLIVDPDQIEFVSVWQYLKTFSIYQDKILSDPFAYKSPSAMLFSLKDTIYDNVSYTCYDGVVNSYSGFAGNSKVAGSYSDTNVVYVDTLTDSCALVRIASFLDEGYSVYGQFEKIHKDSLLKGFSKIIFDVRENRGGDIVVTDDMINDILPPGKHYIHAHERSYDHNLKTASTIDHDWVTNGIQWNEFKNKKIAVLVNSNSASASEIFACALKDCAGAPLIGCKTFGKGIGQIYLVRRERPTLKITYLHLYRVRTHEDYHRVGITPDTIAQSIRNADFNVPDTALFYAVKTLQPTATRIKFPSTKNNAAAPTVNNSGLSKVIYESDFNN